MKFTTALIAGVLLLAGVSLSHAAIRIAEDRGGKIGTYIDRYQGLRSSGETVIIDGLCASACTMVLGAVPRERICVTSQSRFGFPRGVGFWRRRPCGNQSRRHADALFALSLLSTTLDRRTRWPEIADDLPARQGADEHVPPLLSRRPSFLAALILEFTSL